MKTAQTLGFFIRQLQPISRRLSTKHVGSIQAFSNHTIPLSSPRCSLARIIPSATRKSSNVSSSPVDSSENQTPTQTPNSSFSSHDPNIPSPSPEASQELASPIRKLGSSTRPTTYRLIFTCKPCGERSAHEISKHGYHQGAVLVSCPQCKGRHVISDHLKIFSDMSVTIEELMRANGELVRRGSINEKGDVEFWRDDKDSTRDPEKILLEEMKRYPHIEQVDPRAKANFLKTLGAHPSMKRIKESQFKYKRSSELDSSQDKTLDEKRIKADTPDWKNLHLTIEEQNAERDYDESNNNEEPVFKRTEDQGDYEGIRGY